MRKPAILALGLSAALVLSACSDRGEEPVQKVGEAVTATETPAADTHAHARGDGTIAAIQGVAINVKTTALAAGKETNLEFSLTRLDEPIMDYVIKHEQPVHVVVIDSQLNNYQHLHPTMGQNGVWQLPITFPAAGKYRIVADFTIQEGSDDVNYVLGTDLDVTGTAPAAFTLPQSTETVEVDGYVVTVSGSVSATEHSMVMFTITKDGVPVELENWLGASGHLVAIRQGDLAYAHMHPSDASHDHGSMVEETPVSDGATATTPDTDHAMATMPGMVHFDAEFPAGSGTYRMFLQFQVGGKVSTAAFTAVVA